MFHYLQILGTSEMRWKVIRQYRISTNTLIVHTTCYLNQIYASLYVINDLGFDSDEVSNEKKTKKINSPELFDECICIMKLSLLSKLRKLSKVENGKVNDLYP